MFKQLELVAAYESNVKLELAKEIFLESDSFEDEQNYLIFDGHDGVLIFKG